MKDIKLLGSETGEFYGDSNDVIFSSTNDLETIEGADRVKQAIVKIFLTKLSSNPIFEGYGSSLPALIFSRIIDPRLDDLIKNMVLETLIYLINIEPSNVPNEQITQLNSLQVVPASEGDITRYFITLGLTLGSGKTVTITLGE